MKSEKMDRRIRIERSAAVDDGYQSRPGTWSIIATVWAEYRPGKGSERFEAAVRRAEAPVQFFIRWSSAVATLTTADRVRYPAADDGQLFDVVGIAEIGRRDGLALQCVASSDG